MNGIANYDPQLEIKVINLLFRLETYSPKRIYKKIIKILDLKNRWNIWLLGRNFYHVCYGRPRLIIPMCELASLAKEDVFQISIEDNSIDYKSEWNSALSISIITEKDNFISCAPPESVFLYGFLCNYNIVDPTSRFEAIEKKFAAIEKIIERGLIVETLLPLLLSCFNIFKEKSPNFLNEILSFIEQNRNQQANQGIPFNYNLVYSEIQNFLNMKCDMKQITPFSIFHASNENHEEKHSYVSAEERKASLLYQRKSAKQTNQETVNNEENEDNYEEDSTDFEDENENENENENNNNNNNSEQENNNNNSEQENNNNNSEQENNNNNSEQENNNNNSEQENNNNNSEQENNNNNSEQENNNNNSEQENNNSVNENNKKNLEKEKNLKSFKNDGEVKSLSLSHSIHKIISADDVDSLQQFSTTPDFSFDLRVDTSLTCCYELLMYKPTLIQLSAFYGSLRCFKFLYLNKASLTMNDFNDEMPNSIASFAIAGGNIEIVRILTSVKINFNSALFTSVGFHRDELFYWFIENMGSEGLNVNDKEFDGMNLMHFAAESNNLSIAQFLIESEIKIDFSTNYDEDNVETPFNLACSYDCVGIVKMICDYCDDAIPKEAVIDGLSVCIASNSADSFSFLVHFALAKKMISDDDVRSLKEKIGSDGFAEF